MEATVAMSTEPIPDARSALLAAKKLADFSALLDAALAEAREQQRREDAEIARAVMADSAHAISPSLPQFMAMLTGIVSAAILCGGEEERDSLRAQLIEARSDALEEAAGAVLRFDNGGVAILRGDYAAAIRALKGDV